MKQTCFKKHLHRRQGQSAFHFLIFILNNERALEFFIFLRTIVKIFGAKKDMVSVPYRPVFGFLLNSSWRVLKLYVGSLLSFNVAHNSWREAMKKFI